ncbi:hypothetical protein [Flavihumibacter petaseus]|uniref:Uncharacterized protein n=1 Tax=Flavihumibacter petaseus NBRC 106054 TaxID=1220578 RepID=A0A0E9N4V8_9BACT|nr:hypothetical protein [Flavihumibacter petaseus]GAO44721.1 hypothetical protein FPE01S_03_07600 [Flavihumibacter petaseus NBRC 106054]
MQLQFATRKLYPDELRLLKFLFSKKEKQSASKIRFKHYIIAGIVGGVCTYIAANIPDSFWTFFFGTTAVISFGFIVFTPYEIYKDKVRHKEFMQQLNTIINRGTVDTCTILAKRIAVAKEFEDEGDLYIIEYETDKLLYLWDNFNMPRKFPCLEFELYEENFINTFGRQVYPLSGRIEPVIIDRKAKWNYMKKIGAPGHLETETNNFDSLVKVYNSYGG